MPNEAVIKQEADAYFSRNRNQMENTECAIGINIFEKFYEKIRTDFEINRVLEIGCSGGYNLIYLNKKYQLECYGIEPSQQAVDYGSEKVRQLGLNNVFLKQGFSHYLPYDDNSFDVVYLGFCAYQVDRKYLFKTFEETDRVLKCGGFCVITDFDTPIPYIRENIHNKEVYTYKNDYIHYLLPYGYTLVDKTMYSHASMGFTADVQERLSTQILYKEKKEDLYVMG